MSGGATQSRARVSDQYNAWLRHHRLSAADSLQRVLDRLLSSVMTWLVIGIALALPVGLNVALDNVTTLSSGWDNPTQISLFLKGYFIIARSFRRARSNAVICRVGTRMLSGMNLTFQA